MTIAVDWDVKHQFKQTNSNKDSFCTCALDASYHNGLLVYFQSEFVSKVGDSGGGMYTVSILGNQLQPGITKTCPCNIQMFCKL